MRDLTEVSVALSTWATGEIPRVRTGYKIFDGPTGGIATGEFATFMARTGVGKTWFGINVAARNPDTPALYVSLEMHDRYLLKRLAGVVTGRPTAEIEAALTKDGNSNLVNGVVERYSKLRIDDEPGLTIADLILKVEEYQDHTGDKCRLVIVDHTGLLSSFGMSEVESTRGLTKGLKQFARQMDLAVLALHQVRRGAAKSPARGEEAVQNEGHKMLHITDMEYGGEQDVDYLWGAYRPELEPALVPEWAEQRRGDMRMQFLKTRSDHPIPPTHRIGVSHFFEEASGQILEREYAGGWNHY